MEQLKESHANNMAAAKLISDGIVTKLVEERDALKTDLERERKLSSQAIQECGEARVEVHRLTSQLDSHIKSFNQASDFSMGLVDKLTKERDDWKQTCINRDSTIRQMGEDWVKAKEETDAVKLERDAAREACRAALVMLEAIEAFNDRAIFECPECRTWGGDHHSDCKYKMAMDAIKKLNL